MRNSRYMWLTLIALICLGGIMAWQTPQVVMTSLIDPEYSDSPQTAIQHFWGYLDSRQIDLAQGLLLEPATPVVKQELAQWQDMMKNDPFVSLKKVEFLSTGTTGSVRTRVYWTARTDKILTVNYDFVMVKIAQGWRIKRFIKV